MKKVELLSPVGNKAMLISAIYNGANAVYLAGKLYGARASADNFTNEELKEAIEYAHLYGVKVYVTINTIIYEQEIKEFLEFVDFLYQNSVDAVIMQDLGMINLVCQRYPNLEVHASTQMHNHNAEGLKYLKKLGVKRAVLARELSLEEIKSIDVPIEKEVFVYGALCICYSGNCLASYRLLNRSGNRGKCAGICRLPYKLRQDDEYIDTEGDYLLSPKELNVLPHLRELIDAGVDSLKIEGRMKSPEYVGYVTKLFRRLIDNYYNNEEMNISQEEEINLKKLYNREFTLGHLFKERNHKLMNIKSPNHLGYPLGQASLEKDKIKITLDDDISQGDGIRFSNNEGMIVNYLYDEKGLLINFAPKCSIVYVDNKVNLRKSGPVVKTIDKKLLEKINDIPVRKVAINMKVLAKKGKPLQATIMDDENKITLELGKVEKSIKAPVLKSEIVNRFSKLNDTPYLLKDIEIIMDNDIFIPVKIMNELRRNLVLELTKKRTQVKYEPIIKEANFNIPTMKPLKTLNFLARSEEQVKYLLTKDVNIYLDDIALYQKYQGPNVYWVTDRVAFNSPDFKDKNLVVNNLSNAHKYGSTNQVFSDIYLNVTNSYSILTLLNLGVTKVALSIENSINDVEEIVRELQDKYKIVPNLDVLVYGRCELMVLKHCFMNMFLNKEATCHICKENKNYYLQDRNQKLMPILTRNCHTYLLDSQKINLLDKIADYQKIGINNFSFYLYDETKEELEDIFKRLEAKD